MTAESDAVENKTWMEETKASLAKHVADGTLGAMADHPYALWHSGLSKEEV